MAGHFNGSKSEMMAINYASDDSLLLPTADVTSPTAGAGKDALDIKKLAEVAETLAQANLEQETKTLATLNVRCV